VFVFAHTGITAGTALLLNRFIGGHSANAAKGSGESSAGTPAEGRFAEVWVTSLGRRIDLRVLLVGSLLPDIIDKPLAVLYSGTLGGRTFSHTLLFLLATAIAGLCLYLSRHKSWLLVLAFGVFMHLVLDEMWLRPGTLLWPLQGLSFGGPVASHSLAVYLLIFFISEAVGLVVLGWMAWVLFRRGKVRAFIRHGQV